MSISYGALAGLIAAVAFLILVLFTLPLIVMRISLRIASLRIADALRRAGAPHRADLETDCREVEHPETA